jgi:hypothetical protein
VNRKEDNVPMCSYKVDIWKQAGSISVCFMELKGRWPHHLIQGLSIGRPDDFGWFPRGLFRFKTKIT